MQDKKVMFSGIKPSGDLTLGNYLGAIKNWVRLSKEYDAYFCVVDLHAITVRQEPKKLRERTLEILSTYIASGLDPDECTFFIQSHVPTHSEGAWILNCFSYMGELSRMTQYKDKSKNLDNATSLSVGLFDYPVLMASDILLYQTEIVPVGIDQKQHVELTRDIANRFNNEYSETFKIPEPVVPEFGAKIMGLQNPDKKMSKSGDNVNDYILIMDSDADIRRKISRAVTDNVGKVNYSDDQLGIKNLLNIVSCIEGSSPIDIAKRYEHSTYKEFKDDVAEIVVNEIGPIRDKVLELKADKKALEEIYRKGAEKAYRASNKTLSKMKKKVGFIPN